MQLSNYWIVGQKSNLLPKIAQIYPIIVNIIKLKYSIEDQLITRGRKKLRGIVVILDKKMELI